jgi:hypothetical protein
MSSRLRLPILGTLCCLAVIAGCGSGIPRTYPVKGKVVFKGGKPVQYGRIEFQSEADATLRATGEIGKDGTFVLKTHKEGKSALGAVAGKHKVVVEQEGWDKPLIVTVLPGAQVVEPRENDLTIEIPKSRQ